MVATLAVHILICNRNKIKAHYPYSNMKVPPDSETSN